MKFLSLNPQHIHDPSPPPEELLMKREEIATLYHVLESLPSREREAFLAYQKEHPAQLTVSQLAARWRVSRQRIYQLADRARRRAKKRLQQIGGNIL